MLDPRDVFVSAVDLPLDVERELVRDRDRTYEINGSEQPRPRHSRRVSRGRGERPSSERSIIRPQLGTA